MGLTNASPAYISYGIDDKSKQIIYPEKVEVPQHLPKFFIFAKKGSIKPELKTSSSRLVEYGEETFYELSKYFNHSTDLCNLMGEKANNVIVQRVIPDDANPPANARLYIDVLETTVDNYKRNSDGSIAIDPDTQEPKIDNSNPSVDGLKIKFIQEVLPEMEYGTGTIKDGTMSDGDKKSKMYPIMDIEAKYQGEYYNNIGLTFVRLNKDVIDSKYITDTKILPFGLSLIERPNSNSTGKVVRSNMDTAYIMTTFKQDAINPYTEQSMFINNIFPAQWSNETNNLIPLKYSDFKDMYLYQDNIETILNKMLTVESPFVSTDLVLRDDNVTAASLGWYDYTTADKDILLKEELYLTNMFTAKSSKNVPYVAIQLDKSVPTLADNQKEIQFTANTPIYLGGGSDGTINDEMFEKLVSNELDKYFDFDSEVMDTAVNLESMFYDSGFSLKTMKKFRAAIALRKDTMVGLSTHMDSLRDKYLSLADARGVAISIRTAFSLVPESEHFGTPVTRAFMVVGSGLKKSTTNKKRVSNIYDIAAKFANYMGAGNGRWKTGEDFDSGVRSVITELIDIEPKFIPNSVKPLLWNEGLITPQPYDLDSYHFPALQTIYDNDTSVLNSPITVMAICTLEKIAAEAWRNFTGDSKMTRAVFADRVLEFVQKRIKDRFDNRFIITPDVYFTEGDIQSGYRWHLVCKIYAANLKTTMLYSTQSYRIDDLNK